MGVRAPPCVSRLPFEHSSPVLMGLIPEGHMRLIPEGHPDPANQPNPEIQDMHERDEVRDVLRCCQPMWCGQWCEQALIHAAALPCSVFGVGQRSGSAASDIQQSVLC